MTEINKNVAVVIPASGIGSRMGSSIAKQYLKIDKFTIIEHTVNKFVELPFVSKVYIAVAAQDHVFDGLAIAKHPKVIKVQGGKERADSVSNSVKQAFKDGFGWVMVHDAARPCVLKSDITHLHESALSSQTATILGSRVKDTMKRSHTGLNTVAKTVSRQDLWHAYTPQCCRTIDLLSAFEQQTDSHGFINTQITDEASAIELAGLTVNIIESSARNIKVTNPEDLALAEFYLKSEENEY